MKKRRIIAGTVLAATSLCWALWGGTANVDVVPAAAAKGAVSAPCAPQTQPTEPISKIDISEPVTELETIPVAGSVDSPKQPVFFGKRAVFLTFSAKSITQFCVDPHLTHKRKRNKGQKSTEQDAGASCSAFCCLFAYPMLPILLPFSYIFSLTDHSAAPSLCSQPKPGT